MYENGQSEVITFRLVDAAVCVRVNVYVNLHVYENEQFEASTIGLADAAVCVCVFVYVYLYLHVCGYA